MADYWGRVPVDEHGTPIPIDPRLLDTTTVQQPAAWYPPSRRALRLGYLSPSRYVLAREDLSSPYQTSASGSNAMLVQAGTSSSGYASTQHDASQAYQTLASRPNSMPVPFDISSPSYAQTSGESLSPYYSSTRRDAAQAYQSVDPSSNSVPVPFDPFSPNYAQMPGEYLSPYHTSAMSFQPMPMPVDTLPPSSALIPEEYASPEVYLSSYPPPMPDEHVLPYPPSRTSFDPMLMHVNTSLPSSALTWEVYTSPEEYLSPYHSSTTRFQPMPMPVGTSPPSHALKPEEYTSPEEYVSSHPPLTPEEHVPPYQPRRRRSSSMPMLADTSSSSNALPSRDDPLAYQSSRSSFGPIPMPVDPSSSNYDPPSSYHHPTRYGGLIGYGLGSGYGPPSAYGRPRQDAALTDHQPALRGAPWDDAPQRGREIFELADTSMVAGQGVPSHALAFASAPSDPGNAGSDVIPSASNVQAPIGIHRWPRDPGLTIYGQKIYTDVCGIVTPSRLAPGRAPRKAGLNRPNDPFHCPICDSRFDRVRSVTSHFRACVRVNGNPEGKFWLDHPSMGVWRGPRNDRGLYMTNRPAWNAMKYRLLAPAPLRHVIPKPHLITPT